MEDELCVEENRNYTGIFDNESIRYSSTCASISTLQSIATSNKKHPDSVSSPKQHDDEVSKLSRSLEATNLTRIFTRETLTTEVAFERLLVLSMYAKHACRSHSSWDIDGVVLTQQHNGAFVFS